jgi:hypothetical protein
MNFSIIANEDTSYLDKILLAPNGRLNLLSHRDYQQINYNHLRLWAIRNARYCFPTLELIEWLREKIVGYYTIELGAGHGDLGYHLGIVQTDSYMQQRPDIQILYANMGQTTTKPPDDVLEYDALEAVETLRPEIAVAAWLTQKVLPEECVPSTQGSIYGADEFGIIKNVKMYIHIGNESSHGQKKVLAIPHEKHYLPWLVSRSAYPEQNVIYVWKGL